MATLLSGLLSAGVNAGQIGIGTVAKVQSRAAEIFNLPEKGAIRPGSDADLVLVDLDEERSANGADLGSIADYTPFNGMRLKGWPVWTMLRGRIVAQDGKVTGPPGYGRYLRRTS